MTIGREEILGVLDFPKERQLYASIHSRLAIVPKGWRFVDGKRVAVYEADELEAALRKKMEAARSTRTRRVLGKISRRVFGR